MVYSHPLSAATVGCLRPTAAAPWCGDTSPISSLLHLCLGDGKGRGRMAKKVRDEMVLCRKYIVKIKLIDIDRIKMYI